MLAWAAGASRDVASMTAVAAGHEDIVHDDGIVVGPDRGERKAVADMANGVADLAEGTGGGNERRSIVTRDNGMAKMRKAEEREGILDEKTKQRRWMMSSLWGLLPTGGQLTRTNARSVKLFALLNEQLGKGGNRGFGRQGFACYTTIIIIKEKKAKWKSGEAQNPQKETKRTTQLFPPPKLSAKVRKQWVCQKNPRQDRGFAKAKMPRPKV